MTTKLEQAARQALDALEELFHSNSTKVAVEKYNTAHKALREALEQPNEIDWIETNKALANEIIELQKQAEQEPVAWLWKPSKPFPQYTVITDKKEYLKAAKEQGVEITPLYAAPVRTKDLTDDEIVEAVGVLNGFDAFRAVIAADRENNK